MIRSLRVLGVLAMMAPAAFAQLPPNSAPVTQKPQAGQLQRQAAAPAPAKPADAIPHRTSFSNTAPASRSN